MKSALVLLALALVASSAAAQFSCTAARPADYTGTTGVLGWGSNWKKQLGPQRVTTDTINRPTPLAVASIDAPVYTVVSGGLMHTAVVESKGKRVYISGTGADGQLGGGPASQKEEVAEFGGVARIVGDDGLPAPLTYPLFDAAAGWYHTCVLATVNNKGKAYCTGKNLKGQLGAPNITSRVTLLVAVEGATAAFADANLVKIVSGPDHVLALDAAGGLWAWGNGARGEIGNGAKVVQKKAVAVSLPVAGVKVTAIDCGFRFCLALTEGGDLYGWGLNDQNQISTATTAQFESPQLIVSSVTAIAAGGSHVLYVSNNRVYSYGAGTMGQTGHARNIPDGLFSDWKISVPTLIPDLAGVAVHRIAAGMKHSVVQDTCGNVYTFGSDAMNQLGHDNSIGESQNFRILKPRVVAGVAARNVQPVRVFAGAYNTYLIAYDKPARR